MARTVDDKMPFMEHLGELRTRIMRALIALLVGTLIGLPFSQYLIDWLARPVTKLGYELVFTAPAEAFWVQMKVGIIAGLFIAAPAILWQVWGFVAPGLHEHEKKYAAPFVIVGSLLFLVGGAFSLFVVTPYAPGSTFLNPSAYNDEFMLLRLDASGALLDEAVLDLAPEGDLTTALAADAEGSIFVTGASGGDIGAPVLAKYDAAFSEQWVNLYPHDGSQVWTPSLAALPNGDVAITGFFDASIDFGGGALVSQGMSDSFEMPNGFFARFDAALEERSCLIALFGCRLVVEV